MSKLQSITRGDTSPQGKPRVYFCAHPREQGEFLPVISRQLLEQCNCAVWYDSEPEEPCNWEDFSLELSQMQLFIVPVTERLLTRSNRAADQEIPFALEHHIPVLPLLQEPGLETTFGQRFGDLQFLDATARDITAIPFEEKLKKFLGSILIGDELAAQVRAAFDAYIFLSYRKKDRREAQKLMSLIHQNEFFRSIAIWYDEFLTPGEHFNEAIAEALIKSKLFTLVVTPSLLEQPNYVMTTEYPMAQKSGTPILPVEMVPTDRRGLEDCYDAVPDCASGEDAPALTECLLDLLRDVAVRPHDQDPRHNYLMGLAYLTGIDVEVNQERARQLIQGSAEQGYEPAMEKLVTMYRSGEGVARNMQQAIDWQKRLVESREQAWEAHRTEEAYRLLTDALWQLGDFYREQEDLQGWRWVWEQKMLPLNQRVEAQYPFAAVQRHLFSLANAKNPAALFKGQPDLSLLVLLGKDTDLMGHLFRRFLHLTFNPGDNQPAAAKDMIVAQSFQTLPLCFIGGLLLQMAIPVIEDIVEQFDGADFSGAIQQNTDDLQLLLQQVEKQRQCPFKAHFFNSALNGLELGLVFRLHLVPPVIDVLVVAVKGGAVDFRQRTDLFQCDLGKLLCLQKLHKAFLDHHFCISDPSVR